MKKNNDDLFDLNNDQINIQSIQRSNTQEFNHPVPRLSKVALKTILESSDATQSDAFKTTNNDNVPKPDPNSGIRPSTRLLMTFQNMKNEGFDYPVIQKITDRTPQFLNDKFVPSFENMKKLKNPYFNKLVMNGFSEKTWNERLRTTDRAIDICKRDHIQVLDYRDDQYPQRMKTVKTNKFPAIFYLKGDVSAVNTKRAAAIVGNTEPYRNDKNGKPVSDDQYGPGETRAYQYTAELVKNGYGIIGGLANGIDAIGHKTALANHGQTVAIVSNPLDEGVYPKENQGLANAIAQNHGALLSTEMPGVKIPFPNEVGFRKYNKVLALTGRDEWQSGLSNVTIAAEESAHARNGKPGGTQYAMRHTVEQGRILAVPDLAPYFGKDHVPDNFSYTQAFANRNDAIKLTDKKSVHQLMQLVEQKAHPNKNKDLENDGPQA